MSGHSKWATIKRKKGANDAKRGKLFAKLIRAIEVAARTGGGDRNANPTLAAAVAKARANAVPMDNIDRAINRAVGGADTATYDEIWYEGTDGYLVVFEKDFKRNYIHIRDVADCFVHCLEHAGKMVGRAYNAGLEAANLSKEELALKVKEHVPGFYIHFSAIGSDDQSFPLAAQENL